MRATCPIVPIPVRQERLHITVVRMPIRRSAPLTESMVVGKAVPAFGWKDLATIVMLMMKAMKVATEEMMAGMTVTEVVERTAAALVVVVAMIATTVVIR